MYKILIHSQKHGEMWLIKQTQEEVDAYLEECKLSQHWGIPSWEQVVPAWVETIPEYTNENGELVPEQVIEHEQKVIQHKETYSIEVVDISKEVEKQKIIKQIEELEAMITPRRIREALLSKDYTVISRVEEQIAILRSQL
jgi:hypothetical protein